MGNTTSRTQSGHGDGHPAVGHVVPWTITFAVFVALLVLTWATVLVVGYDLGPLNVWVAMAIATVKAALVVLYFMHLRYDKPFIAVVLIVSLAFTALFIALAVTDSAAYQSEIIWQQVELRPRE